MHLKLNFCDKLITVGHKGLTGYILAPIYRILEISSKDTLKYCTWLKFIYLVPFFDFDDTNDSKKKKKGGVGNLKTKQFYVRIKIFYFLY